MHVCVFQYPMAPSGREDVVFRNHARDSSHKNAAVCSEIRSALRGFKQTSTMECGLRHQTRNNVLTLVNNKAFVP